MGSGVRVGQIVLGCTTQEVHMGTVIIMRVH